MRKTNKKCHLSPLWGVFIIYDLVSCVFLCVPRAPRQCITFKYRNKIKLLFQLVGIIPMKNSCMSSKGNAGSLWSLFFILHWLYASRAMLSPPWSAKFSPRVVLPSTWESKVKGCKIKPSGILSNRQLNTLNTDPLNKLPLYGTPQQSCCRRAEPSFLQHCSWCLSHQTRVWFHELKMLYQNYFPGNIYN